TGPGVVLLSVAALAGYLTLFVIAARVAGAQATAGELLPLLVPALLVMGLPINIGGWGPREAVTAVVFGAAGLGATQGLTAAVVYGVLSLVACLPGAGVLLLGRSSTGGRDRPSAHISSGGRALGRHGADH
ncbi:MAG TPA: lysylphosphatidylglycerol synthase domain-containing protein, partial [Pseudonocardiaceae bacterium]|nr:lysylphosphatidylglycerol synthase domain-containing protein [Pseudonocardiaceae bacterium]